MGFLTRLFGGAGACRDAMRDSYANHLKDVRQGKVQVANIDDAHYLALYGALSSRYWVRGMQVNEALMMNELSPFCAMTNEGQAIEALAEYAVYQERPYEARTQWLGLQINSALKFCKKDSPYLALAAMGVGNQVSWCGLLNPEIRKVLERLTPLADSNFAEQEPPRSVEEDAKTQCSFGVKYHQGLGVAKDFQEAMKWYRLAADNGDAMAQHNIGVMYCNGQGLAQNFQEALNWYRLSANAGFVHAYLKIGELYFNGQGVPQDYVQAAQWYRKAAEQGHVAAQRHMGYMYEDGKGVPQDDGQAAQWYRRAADQGDAIAQFTLGSMYFIGQGVPQDYAQTAQWHRKAADQGNALAQMALGTMYVNGQGVPQDHVQAEQWFRKAADQGDVAAQRNLGVMYEGGKGVPQNYAQAIQWYRKAADQGYAAAQKNIAEMYYEGRGVAQDRAEATKWYRLAAYSPEEQKFVASYEKDWPDITEGEALKRRADYEHFKIDSILVLGRIKGEPDEKVPPWATAYSPEEQKFLASYEKDWPDITEGETLKRRAEYQRRIADLGNAFRHILGKPQIMHPLSGAEYSPEEQKLLADYAIVWPDISRGEALKRREEYEQLTNFIVRCVQEINLGTN